ncbi:MAG TPA: 4-(cytidine 5'-diphospho)-2-C-methyl-D-erythritol kinase [Methylophilaceae bacterium]|nr:4-(cytidine 5'-diphospho)-2-C-methyl-D-erythritol kinase [Methylophilaceae bacterium]
MQDFELTDDFHAFPAPAKINLFLHVVGQRADGYHLLQTVFRFLDYYDTVHIRPRTDGIIRRVMNIPNVPEDQDLCVRAARLIKQYTDSPLGADIVLEKKIPMGGGLGGGSSDAATVLLALNHLWNLELSRPEMQALGLKLGADVPVFVFGQNAWAEGIGEALQPITLKPAWYVVLTPPVHVSTAEVFASKELTRNTIPTTIAAFSGEASGTSSEHVRIQNDLESVVCRQYPAIASCLNWLNQFSQARMSGSGASVFAEFASHAEAESVLDKLAEENAGLPMDAPVAGFVAHGLNRHPLYDLAV